MIELVSDPARAVLWGGALLGMVYGVIGQWSRFCAVGGLLDWWSGGHRGRLGGFIVAMLVALTGSQLLHVVGYVNLNDTHYTDQSVSIAMVPLGGMLFGLGMTLANACGTRSLVLLGEGSLRSLVVLLSLGIAAGMTLTGVVAPLRIRLEDAARLPLPGTTLPEGLMLAGLLPMAATVIATGILIVVLVALLRPNLKDMAPRDWSGGLVIGTLVPAGWWITGVFGGHDVDPRQLTSLTFVVPISNSLEYLMLSSGTRLQFGTVVVYGIVAGSLAMALLTDRFRWRGFRSTGEFGKAIIGGLLMGFGGVLALGCTLGQGLTGFSTLALSSFLAIAGIIPGARLAFRLQQG